MVGPGQCTLADLVDRARCLTRGSGRVVLGVSGEPGAGKSALVQELLAALVDRPPAGMPVGTWVAHVPMDGFHLADAELTRLGLLNRKGAPETFDGAGYAALLARLLAGTDETVYAPAFDRSLEQPLAGAVPVHPQTRLVLTEGNYLLLDSGPWPRARALMAEVWHCQPDDRRRVAQLVTRHTAYGKTPNAARDWALGPDQANAGLVRTAAHRADLIVGDEVLRALPGLARTR